ncbi:hypothetical protein [Dyadobacter sp. 3J3]|uniref:hypothetical protein n=1 Tax=Dyadobacter sp. 3J3 TaxID=2606600 RepID=UPI00135CC12E|nr:hypothetical protein [Dyadobacter sp. 3J3]
MKRKLQFSSKHFAVTLVSAFILSSSTLFAQVKIGANSTTIGANSNLEVEATNGNKTVITKDAGKLIIDGNVQIKTLPAAASADKNVSTDVNGNLTVRDNIITTPLTLFAPGDGHYTADDIDISDVVAVRSGNMVCLEGIISAKKTILPNGTINLFTIGSFPTGFKTRGNKHVQGPAGGYMGAVHTDVWEQYSVSVIQGNLGFYLTDGVFEAGHIVSLFGFCYMTAD